MSWQGVKDWLADADPGALLAIGFVTLIFVLAIYAMRHWAKRKKALIEMMPRLGFTQIEEPPKDLVPELLMHPNEFEAPQPHKSFTQELFRRVPMAWRGHLAKHPVVVMDVSISRLHSGVESEGSTRHFSFESTVLCCPAPSGEAPPDFLLREQVLFKKLVKHHRSINGVEYFGRHHAVFSEAPESELAAWITPALEEVLGRHRLWRLATHGGGVYLCRGSSREEARQMESFLSEGEELLRAFLGDPASSFGA